MEYTQLNGFQLNPSYVILYSLVLGKVTSLAVSNTPGRLGHTRLQRFPSYESSFRRCFHTITQTFACWFHEAYKFKY